MAHNDEVKLHFLDYWRVVRVRWGLISLAFFLVLITAAIVTYFQPREYKASAFIEVKSTAENPRIFGNDLHQPVHDPELAPTVFQVKRVEEEKEIMNRGIATMNEQVAREQKAVSDAAAEVARIRDQEHIIDLNPEGMEDTQTAVNSIVLKQEEGVNEAEMTIEALGSRLEQIRKLKGEELMRMLATLNIQDPTIQKILPNYQEAVAQDAFFLNSGLGENHPKVKALRATKAVYAKQLEEQIDRKSTR